MCWGDIVWGTPSQLGPLEAPPTTLLSTSSEGKSVGRLHRWPLLQWLLLSLPTTSWLPHFSFVFLRGVHHPSASLGGRETPRLQSFNWKQRQTTAIWIAIHSLPSASWSPAIQRAGGWGLAGQLPYLAWPCPGQAASRGFSLHFKPRAVFFVSFQDLGEGGSDSVMESDKEKLLHTLYLLASSSQEFPQKVLVSL